jgi:hypothetical protein
MAAQGMVLHTAQKQGCVLFAAYCEYMKEETRKLRHERHTVSLLTDYMVFTPIHIFFKYPPKYSLSFIAKRLKGRTSRILRKEFPHLKEFCDDHLWAPSCYHGSVGNGWEVVEKYISGQDTHYAKSAMYMPRS